MIKDLKAGLEEEAQKVIFNLKKQLLKVRTGRASVNALETVFVDYYGTNTPVAQVGQVSTPEARLLQIQPFDRTMISVIEKAVLRANLGLTPSNDGNLIRIPFPPLTESRRKTQVKEVKRLGEDAKINMRNIRRDKNEIIKKAKKLKKISEDDSKRWQSEIQTEIDKFIKKIDEIILNKEKELLRI